MAGDAVKDLVSRWRLDMADWSPTVTKARATIQQAADADKIRTDASIKATQKAISQLEKQIDLEAKVTQSKSAAVAALKAETSEVQKQAVIQNQIAQDAINATRQQIAVEQLRAAAAKAAFAEQKLSTQALSDHKKLAKDVQADTQAAFNAVAKGSVKKKTTPSQDFSKIPVVTATKETSQTLPERDAQKVDKRTTAAPTVNNDDEVTKSVASSTDSTVADAANAAAVSQTTKATAGQAEAEAASAEVVAASEKAKQEAIAGTSKEALELAAATLELTRAEENRAETMQAIEKGTLDLARGTEILGHDIEDTTKASIRLKLAQDALKKSLTPPEPLKPPKKYEFPGFGMFPKTDPEIHTNGSNNKSGANNSGGIGVGREDKDTVDFFMGRSTTGPIQALISKVPGLQTAIGSIFPLVGIATFGKMLVDLGVEFYAVAKAAEDLGNKVRLAFSQEAVGMQRSTDEVMKSIHTMQQSMDEQLHRSPQKTNAEIELDNIKLAADRVLDITTSVNAKIQDLIEKSSVGYSSAQRVANRFLNLVTEGSTEGSRPTDVTNQLDSDLESFGVKDTSLQYELRKLKPQGDKPATPEQQKAIDKKQKEIDDNQKKREARAAEVLKMGRASYTKRSWSEDHAIYGDDRTPTYISDEEYARLSKMTEDQRAAKGIVDLRSSQQNTNANRNKIDKAAGVLDITNKASDELRVKQMQDAQETQDRLENQRLRALQDELTLAQAHYGALKELAANHLKDVELGISAEGRANEAMYKQGEETASKYYTTKRELANKTLDAVLADIEKERNDDLAVLEQRKRSDPMMWAHPEMYRDEATRINSTYDTKRNEATSTRDSTVADANAGEFELNKTEYLDKIQGETDIRLKAIASITAANKNAYETQSKDAATYISDSFALIEQERKAKVANLETQMAQEAPDTPKYVALQRQMVGVQGEAQDKTDELQRSIPEVYHSFEDARYGTEKSYFSARESALNTPYGAAPDVTEQRTLIEQQMDSEAKHKANLAFQLGNVDQKEQPQLFTKLKTEILASTTALGAFADNLRKLSTVEIASKGAGAVVGAAGGALQNVLTSRYGQGMLSGITGAAQSLASAPEELQSMHDNFKAAFNQPDNNSDGSKRSFGQKATDGMDKFAKGLASAVEAVGGFVNSISHAGSASAGALAGGMSGAGIGGQLGGPIGALAGAAGGALLGGVMGQKQEEVTDDINHLNLSFKEVMNSYSANNASLSSTIQSLKQLIAEAQADMASTKKGGSQFKDLIQQYNDQIMKLEAQQEQQMTQLRQQLLVLGEASPYQDMLQNIQSILQQYEQFAGAASSAEELAQANQFLTESLQQLGQQYSQQLLQNETTAVQDALTLNQLYNQRNELQRQYLQTTESIMGQGTLTRTQTSSQSKFSQLYDANVNYQNQKDTLDEQIAMEQYKVQAEQQIFNLATTKQGLEMQLLGLQEQGINLDMARILAMQNLLGVMQQSGYSITNLSGININDPNTAITQLLQLLTGQINSSNGSSLLTSILSQAYNSNSSMGYGAYRASTLV